MHLPSGENATDVIPFVCPRKGSPTGFPVSASQMRTVRSLEPEAMCLLSGENATDRTVFVCPLNMKMEAGVRPRVQPFTKDEWWLSLTIRKLLHKLLCCLLVAFFFAMSNV